jgi:exosome complex RNA-binding protein Rrp4
MFSVSFLLFLHSHFPFEVAVGMNGAVWLRAAGNNVVQTIVLRNALLYAENLVDDAQVIAVVDELFKMSQQVKKPSN